MLGKKDIAQELQLRMQQHGLKLNQKTASSVVDEFVEIIRYALAENGESVNLQSFGKFTTNYLKPQYRISPSTGESVYVPGRNIPKFVASKNLKNDVKSNSLKFDDVE